MVSGNQSVKINIKACNGKVEVLFTDHCTGIKEVK